MSSDSVDLGTALAELRQVGGRASAAALAALAARCPGAHTEVLAVAAALCADMSSCGGGGGGGGGDTPARKAARPGGE